MDVLDQDSVYQSFTFPIERGRISGGFEIPSDLSAGNYALRAYTNWNRNYPESDQFLMSFPVLDPSLKPQSVLLIEEEVFGAITVQPSFSITDSLSYRVMDLELSFLDEFQNLLLACRELGMVHHFSVLRLSEFAGHCFLIQ